MNFNVPSRDHILDFYIGILVCGLDPRTANEVNQGSGAVWCNAGASQFHLPYGEEAHVIPRSIGLWYDSLQGLKKSLAKCEDLDDDKKYLHNTIVKTRAMNNGNPLGSWTTTEMYFSAEREILPLNLSRMMVKLKQN